MLDFDSDGDLDLFVANGATRDDPENGPGSRLYENISSDDRILFKDVTPSSGIEITRWAMGAAAGDYDGDGHVDLYVTCYGPNILMRNRGDGTFEDATGKAGVGIPGWSTSAAFGDLDLDGRLDAVLIEQGVGSAGHHYLRSVAEAGSRAPRLHAPQAIHWAVIGDPLLVDLDDDGRPDLVAPSLLGGGLLLRGAGDLVERNAAGELRITDHKTGRSRVKAGAVIDGGLALQPVLYSLAVEKLFAPATVTSGRLYYCTSAGNFEARDVPPDGRARAAARIVAEVVGASLEEGFLPAAPAGGACRRCAYQGVFGPR